MTDLPQLLQSLKDLEQSFAQELASAAGPKALEQLRVKYLGRKSLLSEGLKQLGAMPPEQRAEAGKQLNLVKRSVEERLSAAQQQAAAGPASPAVDPTLPGIMPPSGGLHPITRTLQAIVDCFVPMGFEAIEGPEIEYEANNFDALNIPKDHPSREAFDTFFVDAPSPEPRNGKLLLRSHTSPVQIRAMQSRKPPLRLIVPGKVYRPDPLDASHSFMFHQVEGLMVDERVGFSDLKGILTHALTQLFGPSTKTRFRPHFFPFTEPSAEVDIACTSCRGSGCSTCGRKGWLEILGCGVVHPHVFKAVGYNPSSVQGVAFGMGVERIAMLKHGIKDIRAFFENDLRFLEQFR